MLRRSVLTALCAAALGSVPTTSHATTGLAWQWGEEEVRQYMVLSDLRMPGPTRMVAEQNADAYFSGIQLAMVMSCSPDYLTGKTGWSMRCKIESAKVNAIPSANSADITPEIAKDWEGHLNGDASLTFAFKTDGKLNRVDLEGIDISNPRTRDVQQAMRRIAIRAISPLNLQLPRKGDDKGKGVWKQADTLVMRYPTELASVGGASARHTLDGDTITTAGRGVVEVSEGGATFDMAMEGISTFDRERGVMLRSQVSVTGTPTAGSAYGETANAARYQQATVIQLVPEGQETPNIGEALALKFQ